MPNYSNLEQTIEEILFNYGGVLQKLAEIQKEVNEQIEALKNAGVKIRRANKTYSSGTVLTCIGSGNGSKFLFTQNGGTTGEDFKDESWYDSLVVGQTYIDGGVTWEVLEDAYTKHSIVESALNASHASSADVADYASSAGSALQAAYVGPFQVVNLGTATSSGSESSGGPIVTSTGINYEVIDPTRTSLPPKAGVIINGKDTISVPYNSGFLPNGETLYLWGSSGVGGSDFKFGWHINAETQENEFLTALAHNSGGKVQQIQFGDIVTPWPGEDQEIYGGPFKVEVNGEITQDNTVPIKITDPTSPINQTTGKHEWAGKIFAGENYYTVNIVSGNLNDGDYIYLMGDSKNNSVEFHYVAYEPQVTSDGEPSGGQRTITSAGFYVRLAKNEGGKIVQIQHGDITVPPWKATYADSAGYAEHANFDYNGPFKVSITGTTEGTNHVDISILDPTDPSSNPYHAGRVFDGSAMRVVNSSATSMNDGDFLYLFGTSTTDSGVTINFTTSSGGNTRTRFYTKLAKNEGGKIIQLQFGDIISIPWNANSATSANSANSANNANNATSANSARIADYVEYKGPFHITYGLIVNQELTQVKIKDDLRNTDNDSTWAGGVIIGESTYKVSATNIASVPNGDYIYLSGAVDSNGSVTCIINYATTLPAPSSNQFVTILGKNSGGKLLQTQFGDIIQPILGGTNATTYEYQGPFQVSITGTTEGTNTVTVKVIDPNDTSTPQRAGRVFNGSSVDYIASSSIQIADGGFVYLNGTFGYTPVIENTAGNNNTSQFCIRLAKNSGGKIIQMQFGDVYSIPWTALNGGGGSGGGENIEYVFTDSENNAQANYTYFTHYDQTGGSHEYSASYINTTYNLTVTTNLDADIIMVLPQVNEHCFVRVWAANYTQTVVVATGTARIVVDDVYGNGVQACEVRSDDFTFVYDPTTYMWHVIDASI